MTNIIKYCLVQFTPDRKRNETINIGLAIFMPDGATVNMCESINKIRAVDGVLSTNDLKNIESMLIKIFNRSAAMHEDFDSRLELLKLLLPESYQLSSVGYFSAENKEEASLRVVKLMEELVIPPRPVITRERGTRIVTNLRNIFKQHDLFSDSVDDIFNHRIVEKFPISERSALRADFALKNGVYHITETIDLGAREASVKFKEAGLKAFVMAKAKLELGKETKCYAVYSASASDEKSKSDALEILSEGSDLMFNLLSQRDMIAYMERIEAAAGTQRLH